MADIGTKDGYSGTALRLLTVAANSTCTIPAGYAITNIAIKNTTANAVTGGIRIGTAASGTQVVVAQAIAANANLVIQPATVLISLWAASQQLFIEAVTNWNSASLSITFFLTKAFLT